MHPDEEQPEQSSLKQTKKRQVAHAFTYHAPKPGQPERYNALREKTKELALLIVDLTPDSQEQDEALSLLNLATMSANAAIARHEL